MNHCALTQPNKPKPTETNTMNTEQVRDLLKQCIEKINAQGGVNGKKLKLVTLDTKGDPKEAINAYNRLVDQEKVVAVLGPPISNIGLALAPGDGDRADLLLRAADAAMYAGKSEGRHCVRHIGADEVDKVAETV